ncbi:MAG: DUF1295 domain-containing protein [Proteobacteria bacterium]|nr:DUF1295 domain-containing protein [Pseudomonadota bacterium]
MTLPVALPWAFAGTAVLAVLVWPLSIRWHDVSIVDIAWAWMVTVPAFVVAATITVTGPRALAILALATAWALRLSLYIAARRRGQPEDRRYQAIRARNEPNFARKSLYLVFGLQAVLAWIVALPLMAAVASAAPWRALDVAGLALFAFGVVYESVADAQLARFTADPAQRGKVMDRGLWRYSRHPNYFGECCIWWGAWLVAVAAGAWWSVLSPLLMTVLLLKISGVGLLERDIGGRRPGYADYVRRTPAFVPGRPRP